MNNLTTVSEALAGVPYDLVQRCDQGSPYNLIDALGEDIMIPGEGYWIHVTGDCTWTVAP